MRYGEVALYCRQLIILHYIGRTGRMGADGAHPGCAYTLVTPGDAFFG